MIKISLKRLVYIIDQISFDGEGFVLIYARKKNYLTDSYAKFREI